MRDKPVVQSILEYLKTLTILAISLYASFLTIVSVNDQVKPFLDLPNDIKTLERKLQDSISKLEDKQNNLALLMNKVDRSSSIGHANIFDTDGYRTIKIRVASVEKDAIDHNSIYYDSQSNFFPQLSRGRNIQNYRILLKNDDNIFLPKVMVRIRGRTNQDSIKNSKKSEICFQVSKSIYTTLGGNKKKKYMIVKAKVIK